MSDSNDFFILTGGPGSGKTSLLAALRAAGFHTMPEAGRAIIQDQVSIGGNALPWGDRAAFAELMLGWELRSYSEAAEFSGPVLFDRGVPDVLGYLTLCGLPVPDHIRQAPKLRRYHRRVFIAPPWPEIFSGDTERKQDMAEAVATYHALAQTYVALGYELVALPRVSIAARVGFVREVVG